MTATKPQHRPRHYPPTDGSAIRPWDGDEHWTPVGQLWTRASVLHDPAVSFHKLATEHGPMVKVTQ